MKWVTNVNSAKKMSQRQLALKRQHDQNLLYNMLAKDAGIKRKKKWRT